MQIKSVEITIFHKNVVQLLFYIEPKKIIRKKHYWPGQLCKFLLITRYHTQKINPENNNFLLFCELSNIHKKKINKTYRLLRTFLCFTFNIV